MEKLKRIIEPLYEFLLLNYREVEASIDGTEEWFTAYEGDTHFCQWCEKRNAKYVYHTDGDDLVCEDCTLDFIIGAIQACRED